MAVPAPGTATRPIHPWPVLGTPHPAMSGAAGTVFCENVDAYAGTALREATAAGLTPREVAVLLAGRPVTALVPPHPDEPLTAYADRATSELFIRYIAAGPDAAAGWT